MNSRVTVATFSWLHEAQMVKARLEADGIQAYIPEEHIGTINPFATAMVIRVQVDEEQLARAKEILAEIPPAQFDKEGD